MLEKRHPYDTILLLTDFLEAVRAVCNPRGSFLFGKGTLWLVYPKGLKTITQRQVPSAGDQEGFVDYKVIAFSQTHTGLKFVRRRIWES